MRVLGIDTGGNALDFLWRCQEQGHEVALYNKPRADGTPYKAGKGIVPVLSDFEVLLKKWLGWADLIFLADNSKYLGRLEPYRKMGYPFFGCSEAAAVLETDRAAGQKAFKDAGIPTLESRVFHDYDEAIRFVQRRRGELFVSKPSGTDNKALSYVPKGREDLVRMLERWRDNSDIRHLVKEHGFILQKKADGCEMAIGGWLGPNGFSQWFCENWEYKKFMADDVGISTGEQGTLARYVKKSKLAEKVLLPLEDILQRTGITGYVDVNCIVDLETGQPWPLELTMRPGWPIHHNHMALTVGDHATWRRDLLDGKDTLNVIAGDPSVSVVITIPDFPYSRMTRKEVENVPLLKLPEQRRFHPCDVMMGTVKREFDNRWVEVPCWVTANDYVGACVGVGETIKAARAQAYGAVHQLEIPNSPQYRPDIGRAKLVKALPEIQRHGYARGLSFT